MPAKSEQLNLDLGKTLARQGAELAAGAADRRVPRWTEQAFTVFKAHAERHHFFTTEDVRGSAAGQELQAPPDGRAWGAVAQRAAGIHGIVRRHSYVEARDPKVHRNVVTLWESLIWRG